MYCGNKKIRLQFRYLFLRQMQLNIIHSYLVTFYA